VPEVAEVPTVAPVPVLATVRRRTIPEPRLVRTGAAAAVGMLLVAALIGTVGGFVLLWLGTSMLQYLR
jgi:hypothetical protein